MAHMITETDNMISGRERPWHGLGVILNEYPTVWEAAEVANLRWQVEMRPAAFNVNPANECAPNFVEVPNRFVVVRQDINAGLGIVTGRYEPFQNDEMWKFIESFIERSGAKIETAGSLSGGAQVWVLCKNGEIEYLSGDPMQDYFLFQNSFDGSTTIKTLFTKVRVVCNNTLTLAVEGASNIYCVRHTRNAPQYLAEVDKALAVRLKYEARLFESMGTLIQFPVRLTRELLTDMFPRPVYPEGASERTIQTGDNWWNQRLTEIERLTEEGAGADIAGVRGSAYGLFQAVAEYADHFKVMRPQKGTDAGENKFKSVLWGAAAQMKQHAYEYLIAKAA